MDDNKKIFISYRQQDSKPWALSLGEKIMEAFGDEQVFLDKDTLRAGSWREQIREALTQCQIVLVIIGSRWLSVADGMGLPRLNVPEDVHREEIAMALSRPGVTVIPVLVDGASMPGIDQLPADIRALANQQARVLSDNRRRRKEDIQELLVDIAKITGLRPKPNLREPGRFASESFKQLVLVVVATVVLSLVVCAYLQQEAPIEKRDIIVVTALCGVLAIIGNLILRLLLRSRARRSTYPPSYTLPLLLFLLTAGCSNQKQPEPQLLTLSSRPAPTGSVVACNPDKTIVSPGETNQLRAYASFPKSKPTQFSWSTEGVGQIEPQGAEVRWDLRGVRPGLYRATVRVLDNTGAFAECSLHLIVQEGDKLRGGMIATDFLVGNDTETPGYGLQSYLLFGESQETKRNQARYRTAIEGYLKFRAIHFYDESDLSKLHIFYLPLRTVVDQGITQLLKAGQFDRAADLLLNQYNYGRANDLLGRLKLKQRREGPYILSVLKPPRAKGSLEQPYFLQDQSGVPDRMIAAWMNAFNNLAAQEQFLNASAKFSAPFRLKLRTTIAYLADGLPDRFVSAPSI